MKLIGLVSHLVWYCYLYNKFWAHFMVPNDPKILGLISNEINHKIYLLVYDQEVLVDKLVETSYY